MARRKETRGACPVCGYQGAYVETTGRWGQPIGWCASCHDVAGIKAYLRGNVPPRVASGAEDRRGDRAKASAAARVIWERAMPVAANDPAGRYLVRRALPHLIGNPVLRYRPDAVHPGGGRCPAMIAIVQNATGEALGCHRTYLARDGRKADVEPVKASKGPIWGGAIRLDPVAPELVIGEGVETAASAGVLLGLPAWAAVSAGNLATGLILPSKVRRVVIAADDDGVNAQGRNPGIEAAQAAAYRWVAEGRDVRVVTPMHAGHDFNDTLRAAKLLFPR